jgi:hypothetical protein
MSTPDYINISISIRDEVALDAAGGDRFWTTLVAAGIQGYPPEGDSSTFDVFPVNFADPAGPKIYSATVHDTVYGSELQQWAADTSALSEVTRVTISVENGEDEPYAWDETYRDGERLQHRDTALVSDALPAVLIRAAGAERAAADLEELAQRWAHDPVTAMVAADLMSVLDAYTHLHTFAKEIDFQ